MEFSFEELQRRKVANIQSQFTNAEEMQKSEQDELEKARHGTYADNAQNRKLNRVGQEYGHKAEEKQPSGQRTKKTEETSGAGGKTVADHAADTDSKVLKKVVDDPNAKPELKQAAQAELKKRGEDGTKKQMTREEFIEKMRQDGVPEEEIKRFKDFEEFGDSMAEQIKKEKEKKERAQKERERLRERKKDEEEIPFNVNLEVAEKLWSKDESKQYDEALMNDDREKQRKLLNIAINRAKEKGRVEDIKSEEEDPLLKKKRRFGREKHDWYYYAQANDYLDAKTPKEKKKVLNKIIDGYEKYEACEHYPKLIKEWLERDLTKQERSDLNDLLKEINSATPYSDRPITSKDINGRIKDKLTLEWDEPEGRVGKKLLNDVKKAFKNFFELNEDLELSNDDLQAIIEGASETEEEYEHLTKLNGYKELNDAIEKYIDREE